MAENQMDEEQVEEVVRRVLAESPLEVRHSGLASERRGRSHLLVTSA